MSACSSYKSGPFVQRMRKYITTAEGLDSDRVNRLLLSGNRLFIGTGKGVNIYENGRISSLDLNENVNGFSVSSDGDIYILCSHSLYISNDNGLKKIREFESVTVDVYYIDNTLYIATENELIITDKSAQKDVLVREIEGGKTRALAVSGENIYVATDINISIVHGKRMEWKNIMPQFSNMPAGEITAMKFDANGFLRLATTEGMWLFDNKSLWISCERSASLPKNTVYRIVDDENGNSYYASDVGVIMLQKGKLKYFSAERWVPDNKVNDIAVNSDGSVVYAATDKGISIIESKMLTLEEKADYYNILLQNYFSRHGFTPSRKLNSFDFLDGKPGISDNDGLWTAVYMASECYRYAVTKDAGALENARERMNALLLLTEITGIKGFTARAVRYPDDDGFDNGSKEWHKTPDGKCEWKGETSSDEMTGHFMGFSVYYDLCADDEEKEKIKTALVNITEHIISNNYRLIDADGKPTTWACWDPEELNHSDKWYTERGINSLEFLAFLKATYHVSGYEKYNKLYREFAVKYSYALNAFQFKIKDAHLMHIDDNLAFLSLLTLLRLEDDEALKSLYLCGLEDAWEYEKVERQPLFSFVHAVFTGRDSDIAQGVQTLREIPLDLVKYKYYNSKRKDIILDTEQDAWGEKRQALSPVAADEQNVYHASQNIFTLDYDGSFSAQEPGVFLLPYWFARYYNLIEKDG